jgi:hypothetical protein
MTDTTKERAQFAKWAQDHGFDLWKSTAGGMYDSSPTWNAYKGWMARAEQSTETLPSEHTEGCWCGTWHDSVVAEAPRPVGTPEKCPTCQSVNRERHWPPNGPSGILRCEDPWHDGPVGTPEGKKL